MGIISAAKSWLGLTASYDAVDSRKRRRSNVTNLKREDDVLQPRDRDKLISESRILRRNAAIVAWAIRKHQDYVSTFDFQCRSGNPELDQQIEKLMQWWMRPLNCDVSGRFSLKELIRMAEGLRTTDGDVFLLKLNDGRLQIIESDRVRTPQDVGGDFKDFKPDDFTHGVRADDSGHALAYAICERDQNRYRLRTVIAAKNVWHHGYFDRYDQIRGVSPLAAAINSFCDIYEASEYALAKMKLSQLFALKLKLSGTPDSEDEGEPYAFDWGTGPQTIQLDPGDDAEFMEGKTPSTEFQAFMQTGIQIGLKSLDIPFSFFSENFTNYSGARQALLQYEQSASIKRQAVQQLLNQITVWRLQMFIADGELQLPADTRISDINFEWIPAAIPWIDPYKEAMADSILIEHKLKSRQEMSRERGKDWFTVVDQIAAEEQYMKDKGLSATPTNAIVADDEDDDQGEEGNANKSAA